MKYLLICIKITEVDQVLMLYTNCALSPTKFHGMDMLGIPTSIILFFIENYYLAQKEPERTIRMGKCSFFTQTLIEKFSV